MKDFSASLSRHPPEIGLAIRLIADGSVPVDERDPQTGNTCLMLAVQFGTREQISQLLHTLKANIDLENIKGLSVLDFAILRAPIDFEILLIFLTKVILASRLIQVQDNVNRLDRVFGSTPLMYAAQFSTSSVVIRSLLRLGADASLENHKKLQAMDYCLGEIRPKLDNALVLIKEGGVSVDFAEKTNGKTLLHFAVAVQDVTIVSSLLKDHNANPRVKSLTGVQPLDYALCPRDLEMSPNLDMALLLISHGADPNFIDYTNGSSALMVQRHSTRFNLYKFACQFGTLSHVQTLVKSGADVFHSKANGNQAFDYALLRDPPAFDIIMYLIHECKASPDRQPSVAMTPLMIAAKRGEFDICCQLIQSGASVNMQNSNGMQAIDFAMSRESTREILQLIVLFVENGADVDHTDGFLKKTPLIFAVQSGSLEFVKRIIDLGADVMKTSAGLVKLYPKDFSKDPDITEYLRRIESKGKTSLASRAIASSRFSRLFSLTCSNSNNEDMPPAYSPPEQVTSNTQKCCMETESRLRAEFQRERQLLELEFAKKLEQLGKRGSINK